MSNVTIKLLDNVSVSNPQVGKKYQQMIVTHTDLATNKTDGKKLFDFTTPKDVWNTLLNAKPQQIFEVTRQKNDKGYWEWHGIKETTGVAVTTGASTPTATPSAPATGTTSTTPSTARVGSWETPEERSAKQVYIVRQSSISAAIAYFNAQPGGDAFDVDEVINTAKQFENYVFGKGVADLTNDFPE